MKYRVPTLLLSLALALLSSVTAARAEGEIVRAIEIQGNKHVPTETILQRVTNTKVGEPLSEKKLTDDASAIADMGYFEPHSFAGGKELSVYARAETVEGGVKVIFEVVEYPQIETIHFEGNTLIPSADLKAVLLLQPGTVFNTKILRADMERVRNEYRSKGYLVDMDVARLPGLLDPQQIILDVKLVEGWVESIELVGLHHTKEKVIRRTIIDTVVGRKYDVKNLQEDQRRLLNLQLFEGHQGVNVTPEAGTKPGAVVVVFDFQESKTGLFNMGLGYSSRDKVVGFIEIMQNNLFGLAHSGSLKWEMGGVKSVELSYHNPYIDKRRTGMTIDVYNKWLNRFVSPEFASLSQLASSRNENRKGGDITFVRPLNKKETSSAWVTYRNETVSGRFLEPGTSIFESFYAEGKVASLTLKGLVDTSDYIADPTRGWHNSASIERAGSFLGGQRNYTKYALDIRRYLPISKNVLAVRTIYGVSTGDLPLFDAFIAGGAETLRGYAEDRFWGKKTFLTNIEYRMPIGKGENKRNQQLVTFLDVGDSFGGIWRTPDGSTVFPAEHQHFTPQWGYGVGIRMNIAGAMWMRIDFGFSREGQQPHFSFGQMF